MCNLEEKLVKIANHNGYDVAKLLLIEEMSELTKAIVKADRNIFFRENDVINLKEKDIHEIASEIADVSIMLDEVAHLLGVTHQVKTVREMKIERTMKREHIYES